VEPDDVQLWNRHSGEFVNGTFTPSWDGTSARLTLDVPDLGLHLHADGPDLFDTLQQLRLSLEPLGWTPLCNGARVDCYPSRMARDMGGGTMVYVLNHRPHWWRRLRLVGTFDRASKEFVGSVADQDAYFERFISTGQRRRHA